MSFEIRSAIVKFLRCRKCYACLLQSGDITHGISEDCIASLAQLLIHQEYIPIDMIIMKFAYKSAYPALQCHERDKRAFQDL
jgi:hypothetical protein